MFKHIAYATAFITAIAGATAWASDPVEPPAESLTIDPSFPSQLGTNHQKPAFLAADQAFDLLGIYGNKSMAISKVWHMEMAIADGYYLYKDKVAVTVNGQPLAVELPTGTIKADDYFGDVPVLYGPTFNTRFKADVGDVVTLRYQGCAERGLCYPPISKTITLGANASTP